jgi:hypothetical protein
MADGAGEGGYPERHPITAFEAILLTVFAAAGLAGVGGLIFIILQAALLIWDA